MIPNLRKAAEALRTLAQQYDAVAERALERGFQHWQAGTLFPQAVNRLIAAIGAKQWTK